MRNDTIIRAWKDERFRESLTATEIAALPENPAGSMDISDSDLDYVGGRFPTILDCASLSLNCEKTIMAPGTCWVNTWGCCPLAPHVPG
jgi:mersacidin/lichenicidin family type 2 lantibiotic